MGTSAVAIIESNGINISNILVSSDGYLDGFGELLLSVLKRKHVNGYSDDQNQYNRVGNFVALVVAKVILEHTESTKRINKMFNKPDIHDLSCGAVEIIPSKEKYSTDYTYRINFNCDLHDPKPPMIMVEFYDFKSGWMDISGFCDLIESGIPDDDDE